MKVVIFLSVFVLGLAALDSVEAISCQGSFGGYKWDLTPLMSQTYYVLAGGGKPGDSTTYTYSFNLCEQVMQHNCSARNALAVQERQDGGMTCKMLAEPGSGVWTEMQPGNPYAGVFVQFSGGDVCSEGYPRMITFNMSCDSTKTPSNPGMPLSVSEPEDCIYAVAWPSYYGCPLSGPIPSPTHAPAPNTYTMSGGSVFLLLVFIFTVVYCAIGCGYNISKNQLSGVEAVPNVEFWRSFWTNVKLGFSTVFAGGKSPSKGYESV